MNLNKNKGFVSEVQLLIAYSPPMGSLLSLRIQRLLLMNFMTTKKISLSSLTTLFPLKNVLQVPLIQVLIPISQKKKQIEYFKKYSKLWRNYNQKF